jgi:aspartate carbamoyltransferase catalytic subunit
LSELFDQTTLLSGLPLSEYPKPLQHLTIATMFYEPSTRTRLSFETAIQNLGGQLITVENAGDSSSDKKGESLEDTIQTINAYADGIVLRHPEVGAAERAAAVSKVPVINAGDGAGEHPTQALLDLYTIQRSKSTIDGLKIALVGDLLNGRTIHSLIQLLSLYKVKLYLIAPDTLQLPSHHTDMLTKAGIEYRQLPSWKGVIGKLDVVYMTRVQKERFKFIEDYLAVKDSFIFDGSSLKQLSNDGVIMHPLPRVNEIAIEVDNDPRAIYFQQVKNGLYMRMALLQHIFSP